MDRLLVAYRYLLARPISLISVLGVLAGLGSIVVVDSVMNGFLGEQQAMARGSTPDLVIDLPKKLRRDAGRVEALVRDLEEVPGVRSAALRLNWPALYRKSEASMDVFGLRSQGLYHFVELIGIDAGRESDVLEHLLRREGDEFTEVAQVLRPPRPEDPFWFDATDEFWQERVPENRIHLPLIPVLFGQHMCARMNLRVGDVLALGSFGEENPETGIHAPRKRYFVVTGAFRSNDADFDATRALVRRGDVRDFAGVEEVAASVSLETQGLAADVQQSLAPLAKRYAIGLDRIRTWREQKDVLLGAIENERSIMNFVLFFVVLVAAFNPLVTLYMMVSEKVRDVGVLISMGGSPRTIASIFLTCGLIITTVGATLGLLSGLLLTWNINTVHDAIAGLTGLHLFDPKIYSMPRIPTHVESGRIAWFATATVLGTTFFTLFPAYRAGRMEVVDALRRE